MAYGPGGGDRGHVVSPLNLIPPDHTRRRAARRRLRVWAVRLLVGAGALSGLQALMVVRIRNETSRAEALQRDYVGLQEDLVAAETLISERDRLARRLLAIRRIREGEPASSLVEIVGEALPSRVHLTHFHVDRNLSPTEEGRAAVAATPILLRGVAESHGDIGTFVRTLTETQTFGAVEVRSVSERASASAVRALDFELVCQLEDSDRAG